ncbi:MULTISPECIES: hypothetical protein [unclassified Sphingomonas]|uniref:hypothetical protein n=1 Tax=unclassified Sphingomonas TaxID=196159 RepID=UPI002151CFA5|nr:MULTISPECIES: hypothetical protein [unclassified Sphingomonas]MCR5871780.1 hypothetical protein [Sphingomonas sp. J344]UUX99934.1 hypothetical protein LRS08_01925 [Sphingomonas sp. J315]
MIRLTLMLPLALVAACSQEPVLDDVTQNNMQEAEPLSLPDPVEPSPVPVSGTDTIPAPFQGDWSAKASDCGKGNDVTRLTIAPGELRFYESSASVTGVTGTRGEIKVSARYTGEGETWDATRTFMLSADGNSVTSDGMTRVRCP